MIHIVYKLDTSVRILKSAKIFSALHHDSQDFSGYLVSAFKGFVNLLPCSESSTSMSIHQCCQSRTQNNRIYQNPAITDSKLATFIRSHLIFKFCLCQYSQKCV